MNEEELRTFRLENRPLPGAVPSLEGLQAASRRRTARNTTVFATFLLLMTLAARPFFTPDPPPIAAADLMAVLDEVNTPSNTSETPPGTEILGVFEPSEDPLFGDWSL